MESRSSRPVDTLPVRVEFGQRAATDVSRVPPTVCVFGLGPFEGPWWSDLLPEAVLKTSRFAGQDYGAEHLRITSTRALSALPGLDHPQPSRIRDTVALMLDCGAPAVDLVCGRAKGASRGDFMYPGLWDALDRYLADMLGTALVFPDLGDGLRRWPGAHVEAGPVCEAYRRFVRAYGRRWGERYQIALLDLPDVIVGNDLQALEDVLLGHDASLCRWDGSRHALAVHGWRSAAAVVASQIAADQGRVNRGLTGRMLELHGGRRVVAGRADLLRIGDLPPPIVEHAGRLVVVEIAPTLDGCRIRRDPTYRKPVGRWPLSAMRAVKSIHRTVRDAASQYVFQHLTPAQALALATSVQFALLPYVNQGLLTGPGAPSPDITGGIIPDPAAPSLYCDISAVLRPWNRQVRIKVSLRPNAQPEMEVA